MTQTQEEEIVMQYLIEMKSDATIKDFKHLLARVRTHDKLKETVVKWYETYFFNKILNQYKIWKQ